MGFSVCICISFAKTKTYLIGPMQYAEGRTWREDISEFLKSIDVTIFDPYKKPFINAPDETESTHNELCHLMEAGKRKDFMYLDIVW